MQEKLFPRTMVGGVSLPRMIIGSNWICGFSHTGPAADDFIKQVHNSPEATADVIVAFMDYGVDAIMGVFNAGHGMDKACCIAEDRTGRHIIRINTPPINVDDNANARREAQAVIDASARIGCEFCFPHHSSAEQLVNKNLSAIPRLPDYLKMVRDSGQIPGLSAHMPELIVYSDLNNYDVESYVQIFNCMGFLMQVEIEYIYKVITSAKKPVMTIKPMAAGRCTPFVGLSFNYGVLRDVDMVTVGCLTPAEVREDVEISLAALERRQAAIGGRNSPVKTAILK